jgi:hypothetical protein
LERQSSCVDRLVGAHIPQGVSLTSRALTRDALAIAGITVLVALAIGAAVGLGLGNLP